MFKATTALGLVIGLVTAAAVTTTITMAAKSSPAAPPIPSLPVLSGTRVAYNGDLGDPFVLVDHHAPGALSYIVFGTGDWPARVPTAVSPDLVQWARGPDAMPDLPEWAAPDPRNSFTWAPAVVRLGTGYVMYISVREASTERECIAAVTSSSATGPYVDHLGRPLVCQLPLGGSIDPSVVEDGTGLHMVWKNDGNCCAIPVRIWEQDLAPDGLALNGAAHPLLTADQPWQSTIVENPSLLRASSGGWWLFYSGNVFDRAEYATGIAYCPRLQGPCRDAKKGPYLSAVSAGQYSPGGLETFRDGTGTTWAVFATWNRPSRHGRFYCCRSIDVSVVTAA